MNAVKREEIAPSKDTQLNEADLEAILHYLRSAHPRPEDLKIKNFKRILVNARKHEAEDSDEKEAWPRHRHRSSKWATALSSSAAIGLTTAISAPTIPALVVATAAMGLIVGWLAATKAEEIADEGKPNDEAPSSPPER